MRILVAEIRPAAAARQGREAAHVAPDASPGAAPRHHLPRVRRARTSRRRRRRGDARGRGARRDRCRGANRPSGSLPLLRRRRPAPGRSAALRGRQVSIGGVSARGCARCSPNSRSICIVCDFLFPAVNLPTAAALSGGDLHAQRRVGDLAAARRNEARRARALLCRRAVSPDAALRRAHAGALRRRPRRLRMRIAQTLPRGSIPATRSPAGPRRPDRRRHRITSRRRRARRPSRTHLVFTGSMDWLPNEDAMRLLLPRRPAADPRRGAGGVTLSIVGRAPTPAVRSSPRTPASPSPAASTTCGRTCGTRRSMSCRCASAAARA